MRGSTARTLQGRWRSLAKAALGAQLAQIPRPKALVDVTLLPTLYSLFVDGITLIFFQLFLCQRVALEAEAVQRRADEQRRRDGRYELVVRHVQALEPLPHPGVDASVTLC